MTVSLRQMTKSKQYIRQSEEQLVARESTVPYGLTSLPITILFKGIYEMIGWIKTSIREVPNESDLIPIIRNGLPKKHLDHLMSTTGLTLSEASSLLHISERTLHRYKANTILNPEISERILEIARIYTRGAQVLGTLDRFKEWVIFPSWALGDRTPLSYLDTSIGVKLVEDELGRIEHGVLA